MDIATFDAAVSATVAAAVQTNGCGTTRVLASGLGLSDLTIRTILHTDWGWYKFPVINAAAAKNWFAAIAIPLIADPLFSPNLDPADFFLFPKAKGQLAGLSFAQEARGKKTRGAELSPPRSAAGLSGAKSAFVSAVSIYKKAKN